MVFINLNPDNVRRYGAGFRARFRRWRALARRGARCLRGQLVRWVHTVERPLTMDERRVVVHSLDALMNEHPELAGAFRRVRDSVEDPLGDRHTDVAVNRELPRDVSIAMLEGRGIRFAPTFFAQAPSARRHFLRDFAVRRIEIAKDSLHGASLPERGVAVTGFGQSSRSGS